MLQLGTDAGYERAAEEHDNLQALARSELDWARDNPPADCYADLHAAWVAYLEAEGDATLIGEGRREAVLLLGDVSFERDLVRC